VHATCKLNGGGAPLKLRTNSGTIRLQFLDSEIALRESLIREQRERLTQGGVQVMPAGFDVPEPPPADAGSQAQDDKGDWLDSWLDRLEVAFLGGVREDSDEVKKHLIAQPQPTYPEIAMRAGLQGIVKLQIRVTRDGHIEVVKLLDGSPTLADAAITALKQWRVNPAWMSGKKGDVISTVTFDFHLR
jgi:TonB family protein